MRTFFTADTHFGHASIIDHCARPFASAAEMDRAMVDIWNSVVGPRDTVWHVGDFWYGPSKDKSDAERVFRRLHGQKHLVVGNHDGAATKALPWASVQDGVAVVNADEATVVAFHYPMRSWPHAARGAVHVFGHVHGRLADTRKSCDVGVDRWAFAPIGIEAVLARMADAPPSLDFAHEE